MSATAQALAVVGGLLALIGCYAGAVWLVTRPRRTEAQVRADVAAHRAARDLATCQAIWPDPPSWRIAHTQHLLDRRKENGT